MSKTRRSFLKNASYLTLGFAGLKTASAGPGDEAAGVFSEKELPQRLIDKAMKKGKGYGELISDPNKIFDLPKGFEYKVISKMGDEMDDGFLVPGDPDGMAAFSGAEGKVIIVRNHELQAGEDRKSPFGKDYARYSKISKDKLYDVGTANNPMIGGTTTIVYDPKTRTTEKVFLSLAGTDNNCAGGPTPWNSWVTCEEATTPKGMGWQKSHGYNFEVPASEEIGLVDPVPLKAMGRFRHEAIAVEPRSGIVYETEDMGDGLIYRFIPKVKGKLQEGGKLQALAIRGMPSRDTRNWPDEDSPKFNPGTLYYVDWIDMDDVESPKDDLRLRGFDKGAARFARGEGMWYGNGEVYWACTNGGPLMAGQIFRYIPSPFEGTSREKDAPARVELFVESTDKGLLNNADNLCVAPWGDLIIAEDADTQCRLIGVTPEGEVYSLGANNYNSSELAGPCFSPDGKTLFFNIQGPGQTLAITGPWLDRV